MQRTRLSATLLGIGLLLNNYWLLAPLLHLSSAHLVSVLGEPGQPYAPLFRGLSIIAGLCVLLAALTIGHSGQPQKYMVWTVLLLGLCISIDGIFTINCDVCTLRNLSPSGWVHGIESTIYVIGIIAATLLTAWWERKSKPLFTKLQLSLLAVYLLLHGLVILSLNVHGGLFQRITLVIETLLLLGVWRFATLPPRVKPLILTQ